MSSATRVEIPMTYSHKEAIYSSCKTHSPQTRGTECSGGSAVTEQDAIDVRVGIVFRRENISWEKRAKVR